MEKNIGGIKITLNKAKGRMFKSVGWTWNPEWGCSHECYSPPGCWAKQLADRWNWGDFTQPHFREHFMNDKFPNDGSIIFVCSMGDLFCKEVPDEWIRRIIDKASEATNNRFLFQTKNPRRLINWLWYMDKLKQRPVLGTTLETNRDAPWSFAPTPTERHLYLWYSKDEHAYGIHDIFLSLEPLSEFDLETLVYMVTSLEPIAVEIGLENYTSHTIKPSDTSIELLLEELRQNNVNYILKENLRHLEETTRNGVA